jgi:hypothetical protein
MSLDVVSEYYNEKGSSFNDMVDDFDEMPDDSVSSSMLRVHRYSTELAPPVARLMIKFFTSYRRPTPHADIGIV